MNAENAAPAGGAGGSTHAPGTLDLYTGELRSLDVKIERNAGRYIRAAITYGAVVGFTFFYSEKMEGKTRADLVLFLPLVTLVFGAFLVSWSVQSASYHRMKVVIANAIERQFGIRYPSWERDFVLPTWGVAAEPSREPFKRKMRQWGVVLLAILAVLLTVWCSLVFAQNWGRVAYCIVASTGFVALAVAHHRLHRAIDARIKDIDHKWSRR